MSFLLALKFLTILPIASKSAADKNQLSQASIYFPLVGLLLGLALAAANNLLSLLTLGPFSRNVILIILLIILTGALHLDGLADTFDALLSRKSRPEMLRIMRDAHIGTMGLLSLICIILLKVSFLCSLYPKLINRALILMCILSRYSLVLTMFAFPYIREEGKAKVFTQAMNLKIFALATAITLLCAGLFWGLKGLVVFLLAVILTKLLGRFFTQRFGGFSGDTLGAINELTEVFVLITVFILSRFWI